MDIGLHASTITALTKRQAKKGPDSEQSGLNSAREALAVAARRLSGAELSNSEIKCALRSLRNIRQRAQPEVMPLLDETLMCVAAKRADEDVAGQQCCMEQGRLERLFHRYREFCRAYEHPAPLSALASTPGTSSAEAEDLIGRLSDEEFHQAITQMAGSSSDFSEYEGCLTEAEPELTQEQRGFAVRCLGRILQESGHKWAVHQSVVRVCTSLKLLPY